MVGHSHFSQPTTPSATSSRNGTPFSIPRNNFLGRNPSNQSMVSSSPRSNRINTDLELFNSLGEVNDELASLDESLHQSPILDIPDQGFDDIQLGRTMRSSYNRVISRLNGHHHFLGQLSHTVRTQNEAIEYLHSSKYQHTLLRALLGLPGFSSVIADLKAEFRAEFKAELKKEIVEELRQGGQAASTVQARDGRTERDEELEGQVHRSVNNLLKVNHVIGSSARARYEEDKTVWPAWQGEDTVELAIDGQSVTAWRVNWAQSRSWTKFIEATYSAVEKDNPLEKFDQQKTKRAIHTYLTYIARRIKAGEANWSKIKLTNAWKARRESTQTWLKGLFFSSPLNNCQERSAFQTAILESGTSCLELFTWADEHGLSTIPIDEGSELPLEETGFANGAVRTGPQGIDMFLLLQDLWLRTRTNNGQYYLARLPFWWSEDLTLALWVLYEHACATGKPAPKARHAPFHISSSYWPVQPLPSISTSSSSPDGHSNKRRRVNGSSITRWMVHDSILVDPANSSWVACLLADSPIPEEDKDLPTLRHLLERPEHSLLKAKAMEHLKDPPVLEDSQLSALWRARSTLDSDDYSRMLLEAVKVS